LAGDRGKQSAILARRQGDRVHLESRRSYIRCLECPPQEERPRVTRLDAFTGLQDWSADGRFLLIRTGAGDGALYRVPASGGKAERVSAPPGATMARWSPDGSQIAYADVIGGYSYVTVGPTSGGRRD
jgi:Tol biopolymer transport system component